MSMPTTGAREVLLAVVAVDRGCVRQAVLRHFQSAGGDWVRAAESLGLEPFVLAEWVRQLDLLALIEERWPPREEQTA